MKKLLTLVVCSLLAIWTVNAANIAAGSFKNGGTWVLRNDGVLYVQASEVPDFQEFYKSGDSENPYWDIHARSNAPWFEYGSLVKEIWIDGANKIGEAAFMSLTHVERVVFSGTTDMEISARAFENCISLKQVDGFQYVTKIDGYAFHGCPLSFVVLPKITYLGSRVFGSENKLNTYLNLQNGYTVMITNSTVPTFSYINDFMCDRGARLIVPSSTINQYPVMANKQSTTWHEFLRDQEICVGGLFYQNNPRWFWFLRDGGTLCVVGAMPDFANASDVPWYSLRSQITSVIVTNSPSIGKNAFLGYSNLTMVLADDVSTIGDNAFNGCTHLTKVVNLDKVKSIGVAAFANTKLNPVLILNSAETIGNNAFDNVTTIAQLLLGENLTSIGAYAFRNTLQSQAGSCWVKVAGEAPNTASNAFNGVRTQKLIVPAGVYASYNGAITVDAI